MKTVTTCSQVAVDAVVLENKLNLKKIYPTGIP